MKMLTKCKLSQKTLLLMSLGLMSHIASADIVHNDDVIMHNLCASDISACVDGEDFDGPAAIGIASIKIKDTVPVLWFEDTTSGATNDWSINTNIDFAVRSQSGSSIPFLIEENVATQGMLTIDGAERVGVGTESPGETLEVASSQPGIRINDTDGGQADLEMDTNLFSLQGNTGESLITVETDNITTNQLYLDNSGTVGINVANPSSSVDLHVGDRGVVLLESGTTDWLLNPLGSSLWFSTGNESISPLTNVMKLFDNAPENSIVANNTGVGMGTDVPETALHVKKPDAVL